MSAKLNKLTVPELKKQLAASGLSVTGRKGDLVQRLREMENGQPGNGKGKKKKMSGLASHQEEEVTNQGDGKLKRRKVKVADVSKENPKSGMSGEVPETDDYGKKESLDEINVGYVGGTKKKIKTTSSKPKTVQGLESGENSSEDDDEQKVESTRKSAKTTKKGKGGGVSKEGKQAHGSSKGPGQKCVERCKPGKNSGCPIKARGRGKASNNVGCAEIDRMLKAMGVDPKYASLCTKAAIMRGHLKITGEVGDLEQVVHQEEGECGHMIKATLGDLLKQPDYAGLDYEDGLQDATVICEEEGCEEGRTYVTNICEGNPRFDCGKFHNHCTECPGFGICIHDYREAHCYRCGSHYFAGMSGFPCSNCKRKKQQAKFKDPEYMKKLALFLLGQGEMPVDSDDSEDDY